MHGEVQKESANAKERKYKDAKVMKPSTWYI